jgi:hypothetical protein
VVRLGAVEIRIVDLDGLADLLRSHAFWMRPQDLPNKVNKTQVLLLIPRHNSLNRWKIFHLLPIYNGIFSVYCANMAINIEICISNRMEIKEKQKFNTDPKLKLMDQTLR